MNSQDFVAAIEAHVRDAAIDGTIRNMQSPPGRKIPPSMQMRSDWYNNLSGKDAAYVREVISSAVHASLFGLLAVLDGARTIDQENGRFELYYVAPNDRQLLNPSSIDLHDLLAPIQATK